jgi:hypothetical protein
VSPSPLSLHLSKQGTVPSPADDLAIGRLPDVLSAACGHDQIEPVTIGPGHGAGENPALYFDLVPIATGLASLHFGAGRQRNQRGPVRLVPEPGVTGNFALILSLKRECQQQRNCGYAGW